MLLLHLWFTKWLVSKEDFIQLFKYNKKGLLKSQGISFTKALFTLLIWKIIYVFLILILPTLVTGNLGINIAGFFIMEFIAGFFLSTVFLCAHIVDQTEFPLPNNEGMVGEKVVFYLEI